jgi:putative transposase
MRQLQMEDMEMEIKKQRIRYSPKTKAEVALEAVVGATTIAEIAAQHDIHPVTVSTWKKELLERAEEVFAKGESVSECDCSAQTGILYQMIGQLAVEIELLKKKI